VKNRVENQVSTGKTNRFMELEGLRGLAALVVFVFHFLIIFYPVMYYGGVTALAPVQHFRFEDNIHGTPLATFISGTFSVAIFFVLSGFVLSVGFFMTKKTEIIKKLASKRYLRLMLPALASVILAWIYIVLGFSQTHEAYHITLSSALQNEWIMTPRFFDAIREGMVSIFVIGPEHHYNSVLWTMKYEFIGSFIIFTLALVFGHSNKRWLIYGALAAGLYNTWYLGFILGMALADMYVNKPQLIQKIKQPFFYVLLVIGIVLGGFPTTSTDGTFYTWLSLPRLAESENQSLYMSIGALLIVMAVLSIGRLKKFMSSRLLSQLGKYTYSLYLVHQPIIYTVGAGLFVMFTGFMGYNRSVALAVLCTIPVVVIATYIFHRFIEIPSISFASYFEQVYSGKREINLRQKYAAARLYITAKLSLVRRPRKVADVMPELEVE
jgi:peptidoglycan/LPS O-acetylase OafA/YrhL